MDQTPQQAPLASRLGDRLAAVRHGRFVGREVELELFRSALLAAAPPFAVLHIYGPGGVGKSTLLREYLRLAEINKRPVLLLDGRHIAPTPSAFQTAFHHALGFQNPPSSPLEILSNLIFLVDTYERIAALDGWLRDEFLPQLPPNILLVLAGRDAPHSAWHSDPGWSSLTHILPLSNLRPEESQTYLAARGIPEEQHAEVLNYTHGYPLALSLVADVLEQGEKMAALNPYQEPQIIRVLLERFTQNIPDPQHRLALEICAHVRVTNEALLAAVLDETIAYSLFDWLRNLSFIQQDPQGVFPHDLAREVLDSDLRWRNFQGYQTMHNQLNYYYEQVLKQHPLNPSLAADSVYLNRYNKGMNPFFEWQMLSRAVKEPAQLADHAFIVETVQRYEGAASAEVARYWLSQQPEAFSVFRTAEDKQLGFMGMLRLPAISEKDMAVDPAVSAAQTFIQRYGPLRPNELINFVRFWMGWEKYQSADIQSLVAMTAGSAWRSTSNFAWSFAAVADPDRWRPMFDMIGFAHSGEADFVVGERRYGVFTHNWQIEPAFVWGRRLEARQLGLEPVNGQIAADLSQPEFAEAVRQALRDYTRPDLLAANPLMRSRMILRSSGMEPSSRQLRKLLEEAAALLTANPKDKKFYRAVYHTYLQPAPNQETAAQLLDLPLGTYRYQLARGVERIADQLWQQEMGDFNR